MRKMRDQPFIYYISGVAALGLCIFFGKIISNSNSHTAERQPAKVIMTAGAPQEKEKQEPQVVSKRAFEKALDAEEEVSDAARSIGMAAGDMCTSAEIAGVGPIDSKVTAKNWTKIMVQYHGLKGKILSWLEDDHQKFPKKYSDTSYAWMQEQIKELRVQRPANENEPDLSWRGIGALSYDQAGVILRLGGSFPSLMTVNPPRARFELARLIAQVWSPCEFEKAKQVSPWTDALKCLGVAGEAKCDNTLSESGWAVSSAVATTVANPGCRVPAFTNETVACLNSGDIK